MPRQTRHRCSQFSRMGQASGLKLSRRRERPASVWPRSSFSVQPVLAEANNSCCPRGLGEDRARTQGTRAVEQSSIDPPRPFGRTLHSLQNAKLHGALSGLRHRGAQDPTWQIRVYGWDAHTSPACNHLSGAVRRTALRLKSRVT